MSKSDDKAPPKDGRFRKRESGNPKGRPKGTEAARGKKFDDLTLQVGDMKLSNREGQPVSAVEAVKKAELKTAVGGSALAQRHFLDSYEKAAAARQAKIDEEIEWAHDYITRARPIFDLAAQRGEPEPKGLAHPDDVIIDPERGVLFRGPEDDDERQAAYSLVRKLLDALLLQSVFDERCTSKSDRLDSETKPGTAMVLLFFLERFLPIRFHKTEQQLLCKDWEHRRKPKRQLAKEVQEAWKAVGLTVARGRTFPPLAEGSRLIDRAMAQAMEQLGL